MIGAVVNTCVSCKHWQDPWGDDYETLDRARDRVGLVPEVDEKRWGTCALIGLPKWDDAPVVVTAFTKDASDYVADLHTRDDFGCTLWEEREVTPPTV